MRPLVQGRDWEILGDVVNSGPEGIDVVTSEAEFESAWQRYKPGTDPPHVDLSRNLSLFLQVIVPIDCPELRMTGLVFDPAQRLLYGEYEEPVRAGTCSDAAGSHAFIVSVDRGQLAGDRVTIRVMRDFQLCDDCGREVEQTEVDL